MKLAVCLALVCGSGTAVAVADTGHGILTKAEYQQLSLMQRHLKSAKSFAVEEQVCKSMNALSPLLVAEKADCLAAVDLVKNDIGSLPAIKTCSKDTTESARVDCLLPIYVRLQQAAAQEYRKDDRLRQVLVTRDLGAATRRRRWLR
jgi:hypothetical protein